MKEDKFVERLAKVWDKVSFRPDEVLSREPGKIESERSLIGDVSCKTNTMGSIDNSVLKKIAAVSR